jgi:hypothetical protein
MRCCGVWVKSKSYVTDGVVSDTTDVVQVRADLVLVFYYVLKPSYFVYMRHAHNVLCFVVTVACLKICFEYHALNLFCLLSLMCSEHLRLKFRPVWLIFRIIMWALKLINFAIISQPRFSWFISFNVQVSFRCFASLECNLIFPLWHYSPYLSLVLISIEVS